MVTPVHCDCPDCLWARDVLGANPATGRTDAVDTLADHHSAMCLCHCGDPEGMAYVAQYCKVAPGQCPYLYSYADAPPNADDDTGPGAGY